LAEASFAAWHALEARQGCKLFYQAGLLQVGPKEGAVLRGVRTSANQHQLQVEELSAAEIARRFPGFAAEPNWSGILEPGAGFLRVEACVGAHLEAAQALGAAIHADEAVVAWRAVGNQFEVVTDRGRYEAGALVIAAGPWAAQVLADLQLPLVVRRKAQYWFAPQGGDYDLARGTPCFLYETATGIFYGFPHWEPDGIKVAQHTGGPRVDDPTHVDRQFDADDCQPVQQFLRRHLPAADTAVVRQAICMYTMSPDEHFIIDRHPEHPRVALAAGLSGHGFKFTPVLGRALVELALDGKTSLPVGFLSLARESLRISTRAAH
jgi:monomeric sarcosine oxidase